MTGIVIFTMTLLVAGCLALLRGRAPEQLVAGMMAVAYAASVAQPYHNQSNFSHVFGGMVIIDALLFVGISLVALRANRFWPMWIAALQLFTLGVHMAKSYEPTIVASVYSQVSQKIGYLMLALLAVGVIRLNSRRRAHGEEADWSPLRW